MSPLLATILICAQADATDESTCVFGTLSSLLIWIILLGALVYLFLSWRKQRSLQDHSLSMQEEPSPA